MDCTSENTCYLDYEVWQKTAKIGSTVSSVGHLKKYNILRFSAEAEVGIQNDLFIF